MNEELQELQFGQKVRHALNQSRDAIDPAISARLHAARTKALSVQRQPVAALSVAGIGSLANEFLHSNALRAMLLAFALIIGALGTMAMDDYLQADDNEEIDSALLADELPINAYLDDGFQLWVHHDSSPDSP